MLAHAIRLLGEGEAAEAELRRAVHHPHGLLRVTAPISFGLSHVAPLLPDFLMRFPDVELSITYTDEQLDLIADGFDVAIRIAAHPPSSLRGLRLCSIPLLLVASPDYLAKYGRPEHPRDLKQHHGFLYTGTRSGALLRMSCEGQTVQVDPPATRYSANNAESFLPSACRAGHRPVSRVHDFSPSARWCSRKTAW
nr:substrate binding domain-containing protein [Asaia prunellae]